MAGDEHEHFEHGVDAAGLLRAQLQEIHRELDDGLTAFLRDLAPAAPPSGALPLRLYVHAATVEDVTIQSLLRRVAPVYETDWAGKGPGVTRRPTLRRCGHMPSRSSRPPIPIWPGWGPMT